MSILCVRYTSYVYTSISNQNTNGSHTCVIARTLDSASPVLLPSSYLPHTPSVGHRHRHRHRSSSSSFPLSCLTKGWRASMEDAHIALLKVPHGKPPTSAAIGAARIGLFSSQSKKPPLGNSSRGANRAAGFPNWSAAAEPARGRAGTFSAGDTGDLFPPQSRPRDEASTAAQQTNPKGSRRASTGTTGGGDKRKEALTAAGAAGVGGSGRGVGGVGGGDGGGNSSTGAGWKAVDLLEDAALFGVFDGHGGKAVADFCRERLPG